MNKPVVPEHPVAALRPRPSHWPRHEQDEIDAACAVLASGKVNGLVHGEQTTAFASEFAEYIGMPHGFCVANGTVALEVALRALGIGPGDEVIVPARSFFATASAVLAVGASPAFADVLADTHNIDPASIERLIGPQTKAIICVHLGGLPAEMPRICEISDEHGLFVIEDCAQAHGASIDGRKAGAWGDAAAFSFCTDKIMSTGGEGGLCLFRDGDACERGWSYKDHGKSRAKMQDGQGIPGQFRYVCTQPGTNFRMTEMQAAIGRRQLHNLPGWLDRRRSNAAILEETLRLDPRIRLQRQEQGYEHAWYKFNFTLVDPLHEPVEDLRAQLIAKMLATGVAIGTGTCPDMSSERAFDGMGVKRDGHLEVARDLGRRSLMLQVDHTLLCDDMRATATALLLALDELSA
ncbi:DegT/DnrJ/EryC1/StrS family aminotransferase [Qipengyuania aquimaris]|uniref:DegT/DnrJ/EryC1/StrS family aminotransferase n=1 Tax=Qipengyuania aquimaris TaxID=255984 RepID=UPI001FD078EE|nr:DegT/DnrJ/EryC1/StrS family aminotransferase [Qipengyuania aquimaris]UOR15177.1 DegT/DnrJ/EryC1/StrS family aminotransferase [Qipengyuania aquimaris]